MYVYLIIYIYIYMYIYKTSQNKIIFTCIHFPFGWSRNQPAADFGQALQGEFQSTLELLRLFAFGTYPDYKVRSADVIPFGVKKQKFDG